MKKSTDAKTPEDLEEEARQQEARKEKIDLIAWVAFFGFFFGLLFYYIATKSKPTDIDSSNAAAILALITAAAVGIERALELGWTIVGHMSNSWWPMSAVGKQIKDLVDDLDKKLAVPRQEVDQLLAMLKAGSDTAEELATKMGVTIDKAEELVEKAKKELLAKTGVATIDEAKIALAAMMGMTTIDEAIDLAEKAQTEFAQARTQLLDQRRRATSGQQVNLLATSAWQSVQYVDALLPKVLTKIDATQQAIVGVSDFVATFKDNPGRRLISLYMGAMIGMLLAGTVRLDVFKAVAAEPPSDENTQSDGEPQSDADTSSGTVSAELAAPDSTTAAQPEQGSLLAKLPSLGIAATGLLIGLGSSPTHEVIQSLKEYKKSRASANNPDPQTSGGAGGEPENRQSVSGRRTRRPVSTFSLR